MRRVLTAMIVAALFVTACSATGGDSVANGDGTDPTTTTAGSDSTETTPTPDAATTTADDDPTSTTSPETTATTSGRPVAPGFTLELGEGGTYTLSEGTKPVYLVFWAEW